MSATLRLSRTPEVLPYGRQGWPIGIDGNIVGVIGPGETAEFNVEPGHHSLRLGSGRYLSPERTFNLAENEVAIFRCRRHYGLPVYLITLFKPDFWISLHQK